VLDKLLRQPGVTETVELRSTFGFLAIHGGSLERKTDEIACAAAAQSDASYYGIVQPEGFRWHVPSTAFARELSAGLDRFLGHVSVAVAVHGYGRQQHWTTVLLGGRNRLLAAHVGRHLRRALPRYTIVDDLEAIPVELRGQHVDNPVNGPRFGGVQIELPPRVRGIGPYWSDHPPGAPIPHTEALVSALAAAALEWDGR
jgi:phage replication-related protein YjqB (UPF0714/DUF867 family)